MRSLKLSPLFAGALLAATATTACTDASEDDASTIQSSIELENGGLDTEDEAPMFDAATAFNAAALEADAPVTDELAGDATVVALRARPDVARAKIAIVWGQLPPDRARDLAYDWSGTIAVSRGALLVRHRIGFEQPTDHLRPRTDRTTVSFASVTQPFADGLVLEVLDDAAGSGTPQVLTFTKDDGTQLASVELPRLLAGPASVDVDADGNRIVATALRDHDPCDHGFMRGRWHALRPGVGGFLGVVSDADGQPIGHLRGIYGTRRSGEKVFFSKYIGTDGRFRGIYAGHWGDGDFQGRWLVRSGDHGRAQGHYRESAPGPEVGGMFAGRWAETSCAADLPEPPVVAPAM